jgi:predicted metal-binding membrane protein
MEPHVAMETHRVATGFLSSVFLWIVMATAMMLPTVLPEARFIALNGKWRRRGRGPTLFVLGYLAVWSAVGLLVYAAVRSIGSETTGLWGLSAVLGVAAVWESTRWKRHFLRRCHRLRTIPPTNPKADRACVTEGIRNGLNCVGACGPMMVSMAVVPHHAALLLMIALSSAVGAEKCLTRGAQYIRYVAMGLAVAAVVVLGIALANRSN